MSLETEKTSNVFLHETLGTTTSITNGGHSSVLLWMSADIGYIKTQLQGWQLSQTMCKKTCPQNLEYCPKFFISTFLRNLKLPKVLTSTLYISPNISQVFLFPGKSSYYRKSSFPQTDILLVDPPPPAPLAAWEKCPLNRDLKIEVLVCSWDYD